MIIDDYSNGELTRTETALPGQMITLPLQDDQVPDLTVPEKLQADYDSYLAGLNAQGGYLAIAAASAEITAKQGILSESGRLPVLTEDQRIALVRMEDLLQAVYDRMQERGTSVIVTVTDMAVDLAPAWKEDIYSYDKLPWYVRHYAEAVDAFMQKHDIDNYKQRFQNGMSYAEAIANSLYHTGNTEAGYLWLRDTYHSILNANLDKPIEEKPQVAIDAVPLLRRLEKFCDRNGQIHAFAETLGFSDEAMHDYFEHDNPTDQMNLNGHLDALMESCNLQTAKQFFDGLYGQDMPVSDVRRRVDALLRDFISDPFDIQSWVPDDLPYEIVPFYTESFGYAQENMEVDQYRASGRASHECVTAITDIGQANYNYPYFDPETTYAELLKRYDPYRIAYIMAYTVAGADWDRRYDDRVREWAAATLARLDVKNRTCQSCPTLHPGLMNSLANHIIAVEQKILNIEQPELASMPAETEPNIPIEVIENILRSGGSHPFSDEHIIIGFSEKKTDEEKAEFLRDEYGISSRGIFLGETRYAAFFDESGITVSQGMSAFSDREVHFSWQEAAERTELMLDVGSFASPEVILHAPSRMRYELAQQIAARQREFAGNYFVEPLYFAGSETQSVLLLTRSLEAESFIRTLAGRLQDPRRAAQAEIFAPKLETAMFALTVELTTREGFAPEYKQFVTDDEKRLRMRELADSGLFDDFYGKDRTMTEKAEFLKSALGTGSRTGTGWNMEFNSDGIRYAKTGKQSTVPAAAHISWDDAAAMMEGRMSERIADLHSIRNDADYYNAQLIADLREGDVITFGGRTYKVREIIGDYMCTIEPRNPDGSIIPGVSEAYETLSGNWRENLLRLAGPERILREEPVRRSYTIFQMKGGDDFHYQRFEPLDRLKQQRFHLEYRFYDRVYSGDLNDIAGRNLSAKLGMIFQKFNMDHPADFTGHSLSVSDIIVVNEAGQETAFFVDSVGFVPVPEFLTSREVLRSALQNIEEFSIREYGTPADTSDLSRIGLAYTSSDNGLHEIQIYADIMHCRIIYLLDGEEDNVEQYADLEEMNRDAFRVMTFETLVSDTLSAAEDDDMDIPVDVPEEAVSGSSDELHVGDHVRFDGKDWAVESIDGDFYISLQNLDPKDNMQKRGMTNWKKHLPDIEKIEGFGIPDAGRKTAEPQKTHGRSEAEGQLGLFDFAEPEETATEKVDTSINSAEQQPEQTTAEPGEADPAEAVDTADTVQQPAVQPAALTLEKELYRRVSEQFPAVLSGEHSYEQYGSPDDGTEIEPLSIRARGGNEYELTVFSMQDTHPVNDPQFVFTVNTASATVQALEYRQDGDTPETSVNESVLLPDGTVDYALQLSIEQAMRQTLRQMDVLQRPLHIYGDSDGMHTVSVLTAEETETEVTAPVSYAKNAHLREILNEFSAKHGLGALDVAHDHDRVYRLNETFADGEDFTLAWIYGEYYAPVMPAETLRRELAGLEADCERRGEPVDELRGRKAQAEAHGGIAPLPAAPDDLPEIRYVDNPQQRIYANLDALRELDRLARYASAGRPLYDERATQYHCKENSDRTLREFVGWGGLPQVFDESFENLSYIRSEIRGLMTPEEYENARASTLTAFYTPQVVIDAMYKGLRQMGLPRDCRILEPACGTGNFITRMPHSLGGGGVVGIELDSVTARIAKYLASDRENVTIRNCGFEESGLENDSFDLAIGNIPFGEFKLRDPDYAKDWLIHDAFFRKALDKVAPGGVVAFITSSGTLDKKNPRIREYLAMRADLIGAIRLPNNAFSDAGTAVTSDIIFLQKREHPLNALDQKPDWCYTAPVTVGRIGRKGEQPEQVEAQINNYFIQNPQMILGTMMQTSHFDMLTCMPAEGAKLSDQLDRAIRSLQAKIVIHRNAQAELARQSRIEPWGKDFTFQIQDGKVYYRIGDSMQEVADDKRGKVDTAVIKKICELRDVTRELLEKQQTKVTDEELIPLREKLNELYDAFVAQYGSVNSALAKASFGDDADYPIVSALETKVDDKTFVKSEIFTKRTVNPYTEVQSVDSVEAALQVSLDQRGKVSIQYMAALLRHTFEEQGVSPADGMKMLISDLLENGVIFRDPEKVTADDPESGYVDRAEYLSGNVRRKLAMAESAAQTEPEYLRNVEALREVLPVDIPASEISVSMGASWIDVDDYKEFLRELSGRPSYDFKWEVQYSSVTGEYSIPNATSRRLNLNPNESNTYGTVDYNMYALAQRILNQRRIEVKREVPDPNEPGKTVTRTDVRATKLANEKAKLIRQKFQEWIFATPERKAKYEARYNQLFNSLVGRSYDGSGLTFKGMTVGFELKQHQLNCIARTIYGGNTLAAHVVGAEKSAVIAASVMKKKELGLIHKACLVVPKPLTEQAQREWRSVFPDAKLLVVSNDDLSSERKREIFTARVATGDYDCVIMSQQQFEKLGMSKAYQLAFLEKERDILLDQIEEMKRENPRGFSVKQIEKMLKDLMNRIKRITDPQSKAMAKDSLLDFETLGFDYLVVDEAHSFKNGFVTTKMTNVAGVTVKPSGRAQDMQMKCDYFNERFGDGHILFATGTPVSNSMTELYVMNRYLRPDLLQLSGTARFDDWAATFGNVTQQNKLTATGQLQLRTSFSSFKNMPELMAMYKEFADLITADRLPASIKRPELIGGEAQIIAVEATPEQKAYVRFLAERALACQLGQVKPTEDNPLKITREARLVGMGNRAIAALYRQQDDGNGELPDGFLEEADSKIDACIAKVLECYEKTKEQCGVQIIFSDIAVNDDKGNFSAYKYIRDQLIAAGIPAEEIVFAPKSDASNREDIFRDINEAKYRVVIASTGTLGTGANIQKHLYALHHLDIPWKPSDFEQREGRILRQGNEFEAVEIFNYVTKGTLDSFLYQIVKDKARYIAQLWNDECPARVMEDCDETVLHYGHFQAAAEDNPHLLERLNLQSRIDELKLLRSEYRKETAMLQRELTRIPQRIEQTKQRIETTKADVRKAAAMRDPATGKITSLTVRTNAGHGDLLTDKTKINAYLVTKVQKKAKAPFDDQPGFTVGDFTVTVEPSLRAAGEFEFAINGERDIAYRCPASISDHSDNCQRLMNFLAAAMEKELAKSEQQIIDLKMEQEQSQERIDTPFPAEKELEQAEQQLADLDAELAKEGLLSDTDEYANGEEDNQLNDGTELTGGFSDDDDEDFNADHL